MNPTPLEPDAADSLTPLIETITTGFSRHIRRHATRYRWVGIVAVLLILSPLIAFWWSVDDRKSWSETVKNVVESLAVLAGAFAVVQWVNARSDRGTDVLLKLEEEFKKEDVMKGRALIEDRDYTETARSKELDAVLRFYVVLYGVKRARQVPEESLSICFRYWLAHYFRSDRKGFRGYIDRAFPTLSLWLRRDCRRGLPFFRAQRFFGDKTDTEFIETCRELRP